MPQTAGKKGGALKLLARAYSLDEAQEASRAGADVVFYNVFAPDFSSQEEWRENAVIGAYLPRIMDDDELSRALALLHRLQPGAILTGNPGFLPKRGEFEVPVYLDYSLNSFNDVDLFFFEKYGVTPMLSPELSLDELAKFRNKDAVIFCHGDIVLVNSRIEIKDNTLCDEKGLIFPVRRENGYWQVLNSHPFGLFGDIRKLRALGFSQFFIDKQGEAAHFAAFYRNLLARDIGDRHIRKGYTSGHLYRPVD